MLLYNDATTAGAAGWLRNDDDGSFLLKHKTKNFIVAPETGGTNEAPVGNGFRLVWKACPTNCGGSDYTREDYYTYGFVFTNENGATCLPPGV